MNALSVKQLTKCYANGVNALKGIDLQVKEGDFFALLGQNGAGKSTTIGIISSLITKTSGRVQVFGHDIDVELAQAKSLISVVPQEMNFSLFDPVAHILINQAGYYGIPRRIAIPRMEKYLKVMGLWDKRNGPAVRLSGGMKRRLLIARAMMNEPKLLILDEPTAGVDIELRHMLWQFLSELNANGTTIILTTHYLEEAEQLCKNVAIIDHGDIIEHANMKSLINRINIQTLQFDTDTILPERIHLASYVHRKMDDYTLEVEVKANETLNELFQLLTKARVNVRSMRNKTNRLEELFIHLVTENKHRRAE